MGFEINSISKKVFNQLTNGVDFTANPSFFDTSFTGNVEKLLVESIYEYTWNAFSTPYSWNVQAGIIEDITKNFELFGFAVGQVFEFYNDWAQRFTDSPEFTAIIDTIENGGARILFSVISGTQTTIGATVTNCGIWADATEELNNMAAVFVSFGMPTTAESDSFESKLDSSLQRYAIQNLLTSGVQTMTPTTPTRGQYSGAMTIEPAAATGKNCKRVVIKHELIINPFWLETDTPEVLINNSDPSAVNSTSSARFAGPTCLRYLQEIELRATFTSLQARRLKIYLDGNTGWFGDNFNSGAGQFTLSENSLSINSGANSALVFGQNNTFQFDIEAVDGSNIPANSPFAVYFSVLPPAERYQNRATYFQDNFAYDCARSTANGATVAGENSLFSNVAGIITTVAGVDVIRVNGEIDLSGTQAIYLDNVILWAGCESPNADISDVSCNSVAAAGGEGIEELTIALNPSGGLLIFDFYAVAKPDKMEILHNSIKVATTSMNSRNNGGSFDPNNDQSSFPNPDWYIGTDNGTAPTLYADFEADTGITTLPMTSGYQQRVWWTYTAGDYAAASTAIIRLTGGVDGTAWRLKRICQE